MPGIDGETSGSDKMAVDKEGELEAKEGVRGPAVLVKDLRPPKRKRV